MSKEKYVKDFDNWNILKNNIEKKAYNFTKIKNIKEGQIYWAYVGLNLGSEIDGKTKRNTRPVLIYKIINNISYLVIPLTTSESYKDSWHHEISMSENKKSFLCFNQIKVIDFKRVNEYIKILNPEEMQIINSIFDALYKNKLASKMLASGRDWRSDASTGVPASIIANLAYKSSEYKNISNQNHDYNAEALELHKKYGGKIEVRGKVPLETKSDLARAYSPGVGAVSVAIGGGENILEKEKLARNYTLKRNTVAIISDGSAILGLGNLGSYAAIPVMEGKAAILKSFAGVDAFPICLDTQDTEEIIKIIKNIAPVFGGINLEDIAAPRCFEIEERLRAELNIPVMHDDQWGAATVALTAFINSLKLVNKKSEDVRVVISGVGAAGVATARLLNSYGVKNIIYVDSKGIINKNRDDANNLNKEKLELLSNSDINNTENKNTPTPSLSKRGERQSEELEKAGKIISGNLSDAVKGADVFIGLSKPNVLTSEMVMSMNDKPIIFALANPTPEIMPETAKAAGAFVVATGRSDYANQVNNSLVFPGFWRGALDAQHDGTYEKIELETFVKIARDLADHVTDLSVDKILPDMFDKTCVEIVARAVRG